MSKELIAFLLIYLLVVSFTIVVSVGNYFE